MAGVLHVGHAVPGLAGLALDADASPARPALGLGYVFCRSAAASRSRMARRV